MSRRKIRMKYRRFLKHYNFDLKDVDSQQTNEIFALLQTTKQQGL